MASKRRTYTPEFQQEAVRLVREEGLTFSKVGEDLGVNKTVIRDWCKKAEAGVAPNAKAGGAPMSVEEELAKLRRENRILREEREIPKKSRGLLREGDPLTTYGFIRAEEANHSVRTMCRVLAASRSAYYQWRDGESHQAPVGETELVVRIKATYRRNKGRYGAPRITEQLPREGLLVNRKRVARVMREHELAGRPRRSFRGCTTDSNHTEPVAANLLDRNFTVDAPNLALVGDITYLPTNAGWVYLAVLIDLFSRKVVGWAMADTMHTSLCLTALHRARATRGDLTGAIHHTDRGSQYASGIYRAALGKAGMRQSMSRKGNCWDNAVAESFFGTLEQELVSESSWRDLSEARREISAYIHSYYNCERLHSTLGYMTPQGFEAQHTRPAPEKVAA